MYLVRLARDRSDAGRRAFADALSDVFLSNGGDLTNQERSMMYDILHRVVHDIEVSLRQEVSRHLADQVDLPHDLAKNLASDEIEVAYPILTLSKVLLDSDLVEIARNRTVEHQVAIAQRKEISEAVSDELVKMGNENVVCALLKNPNARITSATMEYLVEESRRVNSFQEPILRRSDLEPALAERMVMWVSAALRQYILDNFQVDETVIDDALEATALEIIRAGPPEPEERKARRLAAVIEEEGEIDPDMMISVLRDGEMRLFVAMFARYAGLSESLVMDILFQAGGEGLAVACRANGMGKAYFATIYALVRSTRAVEEKEFQREMRAALTLYERMDEDSAKKVISRWRRNVNYLAAIRDLQVG
jgi:uncharacterized protein (DUF2336 family)